MRKLFPVTLIAALCAVLASQAFAAGKTVNVGDDYFVERGDVPTVRVKQGTRVTWKWVGKDLHNLTVTKGPRKFHSEYKKSGMFSKKMKKPGRYTIVCSIHQPDMTMRLRVVRK